MNWIESLAGQSKIRLTMLGLLLVALIGGLDYIAPPEVATFIFYLIPILFATWFIGKWIGLLLSAASTATWFAANVRTLPFDPNPLIPYWNAAVRFISFLIMTLILSALKTASFRLEQEETKARTDVLTGIANRRSFYEIAEREIARGRRYSHPLTIVYLDLDDFKRVNDGFGHDEGDALLKRVSELLCCQIRTTDLVARLGGDEFVLLLPETNQEMARLVVERIWQGLHDLMEKDNWPVSVSIGVVTFRELPNTVDQMVSVADACMYSAKSSGKNRIEYQIGIVGGKGDSQ